MGDSGGQEAPVCLICHDSVLSQSASALRCGHVYHSHCISLWLAQSSSCPQCKKTASASQLRRLDFEVIELLPQSLDEVRRLLAESAAGRSQIVEDLGSERVARQGEIRKLREQLAEAAREAENCKRSRRELQQQGPQREAELAELTIQKDKAMLDCSEMRTHLDHEQQRTYQKLPIKEPKEDDPDCREERRKLRQLRAAERARLLHEALASAYAQEAESRIISQNYKDNADKVEEELRKARQQEHKLRRDLHELREEAAVAAESSLSRSQGEGKETLGRSASTVTTASLNTATPPESPEASSSRRAEPTSSAVEPSAAATQTPPPPGQASAKRRQAGQTVLPRAGKTSKPLHGLTGLSREDALREEEEDAMLFGGPAKRRPQGGQAGSSLLLARAASGKAAAKMPSTNSASAKSLAAVVTPSRKPTCLQTLFSKRHV
eukprot:gb/GFBE01027283.1/.p1 GENE.gb/GFBE01027283.1/~~gb/GFBE01027283.1/.p1  ORF type:complete len:438 (+),score=103.46 gb/GFBE01027283.1/:1-1314(+)